MGVPMYMRGVGSDSDPNLDDLRREIRRLKVIQASEIRLAVQAKLKKIKQNGLPLLVQKELLY